MANLDISLDIVSSNPNFDFDIKGSLSGVIELDVDTGGGGEKLPPYTGNYEVQPKITEQILKTKNKSMLDDVTVYQIPFKEVSNPEGGTTVTIGLE